MRITIVSGADNIHIAIIRSKDKDLAYYNGANQVWQYIEEHIDDPDLMDHLFLDGKTVATDPDQSSLAYETHVGGL